MTLDAVSIDAPSCPQCGSATLSDRGGLARGTWFAGQVLDPPWPGGRLLACAACALAFRHPRAPQSKVDEMYATTPATTWSRESLRDDQRKVLEAIRARRRSGSVLDIGCHTGTMLGGLPEGFERFGVEPSTAAIEVARSRGIEIVATDFQQLAALQRKFDVVTATDVIEHVPDPLDFLRVMVEHTQPGGLVILSTGNADAPAWRFFGARYWYCSLPEHVSFISPVWAERAAARLRLTQEDAQAYRYDIRGPELRRKSVNFIGKFVLGLADVLWRQPLSARERALGPRWSQGSVGIFNDHILLTFGKPAETGASVI